jgi:hypothetical protein
MNTDAEPAWDNLSPGAIDARRVDPAGRHDYFWVVSERAEPGLLLRLAPGTDEVKPLPKMRNLDVAYRDTAGGKALVLLLRDGEQRELFASLCRDIVRAGEEAADSQGALQRSVRRTLRWHHLLRGGKSDLLSIEEQRGLLGELQFLGRLVDLLGPRAAIEAWKGPAGSAKDFELDGCLVEVKARRGAAKPFVQISSEDQLADVDGCRLFLVVSLADAAIKPNGQTLTDHVLVLDKIFAAADPEAYRLWEESILAAGFDFEDDYSDRRWSIGKCVELEVTDGFPRIATPVAAGVSGVRYSISLDACSPFTSPAGDLDDLIVRSNG